MTTVLKRTTARWTCFALVWVSFVAGGSVGFAETTKASSKRPGIIFTDDATLHAVSNEASLKLTLSKPLSQNIELVLPDVDDPARVLAARDLTQIGAILRRLAQTYGVLTYVWIGEAADLPRKVAETARLVRAHPVEAKVAVLLFTEKVAKSAFLLSNLLAEEYDLAEFKKLAAELPVLSKEASRGESVARFVDAFEVFLKNHNDSPATILPEPAEEFLQQNKPNLAVREQGETTLFGVKDRATSGPEAGVVEQKDGPPSAAKTESEQATQPGFATLPTDLPQQSFTGTPPPPRRFKFDRAGKLLVFSVTLILLPVAWRIVASLWGRFKQSRRKLPERTILGRPSGPLLNAAHHLKRLPRGPRMHPIEQRFRAKPRAPFRPR